jgi:hypothetical protein
VTDPLEALARRAEGEPFFLASVLAAFARSEGLDEAGLAAWLGCLVGELVMVRLCRAPRTDPAEFREDLGRIAERFGLDRRRLAEAVKRGVVVARLREAPAGGGGLLAARDREEAPPEEGAAGQP